MAWNEWILSSHFSYLFIANLTQGSIDYFKFFVQSMCKLAVLNSISFGLVTNSWDVLTYLEVWINEFIKQIFQVANWKKKLFWNNKKCVFLRTAETKKDLWNKLVKQIGENIWWIDLLYLNYLLFNICVQIPFELILSTDKFWPTTVVFNLECTLEYKGENVLTKLSCCNQILWEMNYD